MIRFRHAAVIGATALLGLAVLSGCSSSSSSSASSSAAAASASAQMLPPVIIAEEQTTATAKIGDYLDILVSDAKMAGTTVATDRPDLVELTQGGERDGATFNPGGKALGAGVAVITVTNPDSTTRTITLTITQ
jgi:ABC-type phosphate/phosphonate transport system substrate-binding protein